MDNQGLSRDQVVAQRQKFGENRLPDREKKSSLKLIVTILTEPMIFLLLAVVVLYFFLGDWRETVVLALSVVGVVVLEFYQDTKTERALEALRSLSAPQCEVLRGGEYVTIPSTEVVVSDILVINEGDRVAADGELIESTGVSANESILTGESVVVEKNIDDKVYSGTVIVSGHGLVKVSSVGTKTEMGRIGVSLHDIKPEKTLLQKEVNKVVRYVALAAVSLAVALTLLFWVLRGDFLQGFLAGLTLSIAILPEEFPVVLSVFMALGAWRLAKSNVLARKSQTIETLGSATVLCTDKTGTLTENRMAVARTIDIMGNRADEVTRGRIIAYGVLASQRNPFDPMEEALLAASSDLLAVYNGMDIIKEYPLSSESFSVAHAWGRGGKVETVALKGAPEEVFRLCRLPEADRERLQTIVSDAADDGLRVLAVARAAANVLEDSREDYNYELLGLVALADPIRAEAKDAVALAHQAGIRVVMITGDYAETARRIGREIGLNVHQVMTGQEFMELDEKQRRQVVKDVEIYSRVAPNTKLAIVTALKANGEIVAMTGDGVNDGPALKSAHIGIAMGQRGTDVAREAASIVLLDDNFASIVQGVRIGRRIFANLQKAVMYIMIVHIPIAMLSILPVLFNWDLILLPIHIVFFEFIIDPSCTLVFEGEPEDEDTMRHPPRQVMQPLFSRTIVLESLAIGSLLALAAVTIHGGMLNAGADSSQARAATYLTIILANIGMILSLSGCKIVRQAIRQRGKNALSIVIAVAIIALAAIYSMPALRQLFKIAPLSLAEISISLLAAAVVSLLAAILRRLWR